MKQPIDKTLEEIDDRRFVEDGNTFTELIRQEYGGNNCVISAGFVEGDNKPEVDACYLRLEKDNHEPTVLLLRPDEIQCIAWVTSGAVWSYLMREKDGDPVDDIAIRNCPHAKFNPGTLEICESGCNQPRLYIRGYQDGALATAYREREWIPIHDAVDLPKEAGDYWWAWRGRPRVSRVPFNPRRESDIERGLRAYAAWMKADPEPSPFTPEGKEQG